MATKKKRQEPKQLTFDDARKPDGKHGGWRPGAGRPEGRSSIAHRLRDEFPPRFPILVTWRLVQGLPSLRHRRYAEVFLDALAAVQSTTFRVTDYSIQTNHLHLMSEAEGADAVADGMEQLANRSIRRVNRAMKRNGKLLDERYHARALATPREVKNALRYVINNARHHAEERHVFYHPEWIDPFSSARWFDGWSSPLDASELQQRGRRVTAEPHTWLRSVGWRRWGLLGTDEIPGGPP